MNESWRSRITIEPGKRGGRPCIRGMRITVYDVLSYLAAGMTVAEVLDDFPYLTQEDSQACFAFASDTLRFLDQFTSDHKDYTAQRETMFGQATLEKIIAEIKSAPKP